jgi:cysteine desulfurase / selenocysteine lyase
VDVGEMCIDYLSADGHKWLLGPEGAGIFYCRRELLEKTRPLIVGWMNVAREEDFGHYDYTLKKSAGRFEAGSHNVPGFLALRASLDLLLAEGIAAVGQRVRSLTDGLCERLVRKGWQVLSPRGPAEWSGIVGFSSPKHDPQEVFRALRRDQRIELAVRNGRLRASPHFYNTPQQIERLAEAIPGA